MKIKTLTFIVFILAPSLYGEGTYPSQVIFKNMPPLHFGQTLEEVQKALKVEATEVPPPLDIVARKGIDKIIVYKNLKLKFDTGLLYSITINHPFVQFQGMDFFREKWMNFDRDGVSIIKPGFTRTDLEFYLSEWTARALKNGARLFDSSNAGQGNFFQISKTSDTYTSDIYIYFGSLRKNKWGRKMFSGAVGFTFQTERDAQVRGTEVGALSSISIYCDEFNTLDR